MLFSFSIIFGNLLQSWELVPTSQTDLFQAPQAKKYTSVRKNSLIYLIDFYFLKFLETLHIQGTLRILLNEGWFSWKIHIKVFLYLFFPKILIIKMLLNSEEFNSKYPVPRSSPWVKWILNISRPPKRFSSVQSHSCVRLFETPWTAARQASLSITNSWSPPKPISIESVMPSNHLILCLPLRLLPSIFPSIRVFSNESALCIRWPKYWSFSFRISPSNEHPGLTSFRMDWLDLLAVQGTLKSLLQHHSSKTSILPHSAFFIVQLSPKIPS